VRSQIVGADVEGTEDELLAKGEQALLAQDWPTAKRYLGALVAAEPRSADVRLRASYGLAVALDALGERDRARDLFARVAREATDPLQAKAALTRLMAVLVYLEAWSELREWAEKLMARTDLQPLEAMTAIGGRALARVELGDVEGASRDVQKGLDLIDEHRVGSGGAIPVAAAQLQFVLGEVRRADSEKILLQPVTDDFVQRVSARCELLLLAQSSYAEAMRSEDPHWAMMAGYRVGQMYRTLHRELMAIPPDRAKDDHQRQVFYGIMHVRYRALLDKGIEMLRRTLVTADRVGDTTSWVVRARADKAEMEAALDDEKKTIASFPFTEAEIEQSLKMLEDDAKKKAQGANTNQRNPNSTPKK
jgi:tetratricopeptide (TPR) repeat protein